MIIPIKKPTKNPSTKPNSAPIKQQNNKGILVRRRLISELTMIDPPKPIQNK